MMEYLFSYGTLQRDDVQLKLFSRLLTGPKDILKRYRLDSLEVKDEVFLSIGEQNIQMTLVNTANEADSVEGMVFEVSDEELIRADKYEPDGYERIEAGLASGKRAWIYLAG